MRLLFLVLLIASSTVQAKEPKTWLCSLVDSVGMTYESKAWNHFNCMETFSRESSEVVAIDDDEIPIRIKKTK